LTFNHLRLELLGESVAISIKVFSAIPIAGTIIKKNAKYKAVATCPTSTYGVSGCFAPIQINIMKSTTKNQNANFIAGLNWLPLILERSVNGSTNKINNDENIAITPNNLLGIDRKIA
jgi:hypothetical protein